MALGTFPSIGDVLTGFIGSVRALLESYAVRFFELFA